MQVWNDYQQQHQQRFLDELMELLRIPSVSANSAHQADTARCAESVQQALLSAGCDLADMGRDTHLGLRFGDLSGHGAFEDPHLSGTPRA